MAQVYQFVDDNGVTRLFAEIVPDPAGTPFNGGTITAGLEIDNPVNGTPLKVKDSAASTVFTMDKGGAITVRPNAATAPGDNSLDVYCQANDNIGTPIRVYDKTGSLVWSIGADGDVTATGGEQRGNAALGAGGDANFKGAAGAVSLAVRASDGVTDAVNVGNLGGVVGTRFNFEGVFITKIHTAPADASLDAGDCAFWFDQTDGAAKLMVKAKTANGTVATAAIALA
jgi:hypothetical protein